LFKTELELGLCLRLPAEGPCECDLYLRCSKFFTTSEYAPRLRPPGPRTPTRPGRHRAWLATGIAAIEHRLSNALIESTNTKVRLIIRRAFGFHSAKAIIALAMLTLDGHQPALPDR
jgi:hypothetical protein